MTGTLLSFCVMAHRIRSSARPQHLEILAGPRRVGVLIGMLLGAAGELRRAISRRPPAAPRAAQRIHFAGRIVSGR